MATVEEPGPREEMNLEDAKNFIQYEVCTHTALSSFLYVMVVVVVV